MLLNILRKNGQACQTDMVSSAIWLCKFFVATVIKAPRRFGWKQCYPVLQTTDALNDLILNYDFIASEGILFEISKICVNENLWESRVIFNIFTIIIIEETKVFKGV